MVLANVKSPCPVTLCSERGLGVNAGVDQGFVARQQRASARACVCFMWLWSEGEQESKRRSARGVGRGSARRGMKERERVQQLMLVVASGKEKKRNSRGWLVDSIPHSLTFVLQWHRSVFQRGRHMRAPVLALHSPDPPSHPHHTSCHSFACHRSLLWTRLHPRPRPHTHTTHYTLHAAHPDSSAHPSLARTRPAVAACTDTPTHSPSLSCSLCSVRLVRFARSSVAVV